MAIFGFGNFESKQERQKRKDELNLKLFPYGQEQKNKVEDILSQLFPKESKDIAMYNYVVTKQKLMENVYRDNQDIINDLKKKYKTLKDINLYLSLARIDLAITPELNYPNIDIIKTSSL